MGYFLNIKLMNLGHNCSFQKGFYIVYFGDREKHAANIPHSAKKKHSFFCKKKRKG